MESFPWRPGHFYSPIPGDDDIKRAMHAKRAFKWSTALLSDLDSIEDATKRLVSLNTEPLIDYLRNEEKTYPINSNQFVLADAVTLWGLISALNSKLIVEVGSGHSTSLMLDLKQYFNLDLHLICIEPYPARLKETLGSRISEVELLEVKVQDVEMGVFGELGENDLLFVDSSHVSKAGSDVNHLVFNVFPNLQKGCYIHVHDVFSGFEYPEKWLREGRSWNEAYILRAFLMFNSAFSIYAWPQLLRNPCGYEEIAQKSGLNFGFPGSSLYLKKNI